MTARKKFLKIMRYQHVDSLPVFAFEPYEQSVLQKWKKQGHLPDDKPIDEVLGMDRLQYIPIDWSPMPGYPEKIISEDDEYTVMKDAIGATVKRHKVYPSMYYGYLDHPIKSLQDWREYKKRFIPDLAMRLHSGWTLERIAELNDLDVPVGFLFFPWFFRLGFYYMGMERFMLSFYEAPELIHDMFSFWTDFTLELIRPLLGKLQIDFALLAEDLAYKTSTHVSPKIYEEFWYPYQDRLVGELKKAGVPVICMWTAGNVDPLLAGLMEHGVNCTWPLERQADKMDALYLRKRYGRDLLLAGNIAKEALAEGPSAIDQELTRLEPLIREGGFIPALDDMVAEEIPFENYKYLIEKLKSIKL